MPSKKSSHPAFKEEVLDTFIETTSFLKKTKQDTQTIIPIAAHGGLICRAAYGGLAWTRLHIYSGDSQVSHDDGGGGVEDAAVRKPRVHGAAAARRQF